MSETLIGVDLCNTIADINGEIEQHFKVRAETYPVCGIPRYFFSSPAGLTMFRNAVPFSCAANVLWNIARAGCKIIYVTTRPGVAGFVTEQWLKVNNFPGGRLVFVARGEKAAFAIKAGISYFFEDDPLELNMLIKTGVRHVFIKDWPYNRGLVDKRAIRFQNWRELMDWPFTKRDIKRLFGVNARRKMNLKSEEMVGDEFGEVEILLTGR